MKISSILDHIDSGHIALPEFQRGYVWNRDQVRGLFTALYRRHPVGGLLVWATESADAEHRGDGGLAPGVVKLLLDGQQRVTSLYGVIRGKPPRFFEGNAQAFTGLSFHLGTEEFAFYSPVKMRDDPLWIDVTTLMKGGFDGVSAVAEPLVKDGRWASDINTFYARLHRLLGIADIDLHVEEVTGADKTIDVVVDIFNRVNSGGTKLSKGDLALAKICADWPEARETMNRSLGRWEESGYRFNLDWLLRCVNTVLTGEAKFLHLHDKSAAEIQDALTRATTNIDTCLNMIAGRLGLDHDQVLFGRFAIPVMVHYLDRRGSALPAREQDKLLFWFVQAGMWGRYSGSTETFIDQDLAAIETLDGGLDRLIEQLRLWHGALRVEAGHFTGWSLGARFYPVLYLLTRVGEARDWGNGLPLKRGMLGKMSRLEVHHIFPKAQLYKRDHARPEVNAVANFCFQTKGTNLSISDTLPEVYFHEIERRHPGALASQWIPMDETLWRIEKYRDFLEARKALLAEETNRFLSELLHGETGVMEGEAGALRPAAPRRAVGGIDSVEEEEALAALSEWIAAQGLPAGEIGFDLSDPETGTQQAVFDMAWPAGLQPGLSQPVAVLIDEGPEVHELANRAGFRYFTSIEAFKRHCRDEVLATGDPSPGAAPLRSAPG